MIGNDKRRMVCKNIDERSGTIKEYVQFYLDSAEEQHTIRSL